MKGRQVMAMRQPRTEKIDLRVSPEAKLTIVAAARATGKSLSQFVLESALARAEDTLPSRRSRRSPITDPASRAALVALKERAPVPIIRDKGDPAASAAEDLAILDELGRLRREANRELA